MCCQNAIEVLKDSNSNLRHEELNTIAGYGTFTTCPGTSTVSTYAAQLIGMCVRETGGKSTMITGTSTDTLVYYHYNTIDCSGTSTIPVEYGATCGGAVIYRASFSSSVAIPDGSSVVDAYVKSF